MTHCMEYTATVHAMAHCMEYTATVHAMAMRQSRCLCGHNLAFVQNPFATEGQSGDQNTCHHMYDRPEIWM